ncbi:hypothetical protein [Mesorhizobium sp. B2-8-9]|uniref:phage NrS-1 polymerase family protein n=1 Tax=Mesorhizobium sp. B2-8-9 TaxID=2589899 RepID=UPI00112EA97B|nr:hypothetical protein [Mesorhizobium sp. B2-8-9]TPI79510.1 hypothetical protein FJ423_15040 [Mesorhizobium sp. B2-8-9]
MNAHISLPAHSGNVDVPASLKALPQFVVWRLVQRSGEPKPAKLPFDPKTGNAASSTDRATWSDYETAIAALASGQYAGLGFVFTDTDHFFLLDLDGCRDALTGELSPEAQAICRQFSGAAWELSQSNEGLHIFGRCDKAALAIFRNKWAGWLECYRTGRFVAFGRSGIQGNIDIDWTNQLACMIPLRAAGETDALQEPAERDPRWNGPEDDGELLQRFLASLGGTKATLGHSPTNIQLWEANSAPLASFYPSSTGKPFDHSQADLSLMNRLAYWTGRDHGRMIRLFSQSALGRRDKWTKHAYYRNRTALNSIAHCRVVYTGNMQERRERQIEENRQIGSDTGPIHTRVLTIDDALADLWFIMSAKSGGAIADSKTLTVLPVATAQRVYAASKYEVETSTFDHKTGAFKTRSQSVLTLWEHSPSRKTIDVVTWRPNAPIICEAPESQGTGFNTWRGFRPYTLPNNAPSLEAVWNEHLTYLVPIEAERVRFEQWLAHVLQRPEELPQSAYLLITEETGIGRNWLSSVLVSRHRHSRNARRNIQRSIEQEIAGCRG